MVLVPELRPPSVTTQYRHTILSLDVKSLTAKQCSYVSPAFAWFSIEVMSHEFHDSHNAATSSEIWKGKNGKQWETAPRCHIVTRQAGHQKVATELSQWGLQSLSHLRLLKGHPSANISLERGWFAESGNVIKLQALGGWHQSTLRLKPRN